MTVVILAGGLRSLMQHPTLAGDLLPWMLLSPGWGEETAVPVSAGEELGHSSFPKPRRNKRGKRLRFGDKAPP
eukprot:2559037-Rhodomonas_salina.1